jgi:flagellum-specific ATP synthase
MHEIVAAPHLELARRFRRIVGAYESHRDLIAIGAYQRGSDPRVDEAIALWPRVEHYLQQDMGQRVTFDESVAALQAVLGGPRPDAPS